jgi:thiol-disulfide isomerase/thioredoxin
MHDFMPAVPRRSLLTLGFLALLACARAGAAGAEVGAPAPPLVMRTLDGRDFSLAAQRGKVVVLNLWATWCPPCRAEMPLLESFSKAYAARNVLVFGASADDAHDRKDVVKVMKGFTYPAGLLFEASANGFGAPDVLPVTYVIDANGIIRARILPGRGALTEKELAGAVEPLLAHADQTP